MLTRDEQAEIMRRFRAHVTWVVVQGTRLRKGEVTQRDFLKRRVEREADFADFLKECGDVPRLPVQPLQNPQHICEGTQSVQAGSPVPALRMDSLLHRQGTSEQEGVSLRGNALPASAELGSVRGEG